MGAYSHAELPGILAGLDAAVIPSLWWDCAPLVVAECLAGRVPVVASRMGGITDFVRARAQRPAVRRPQRPRPVRGPAPGSAPRTGLVERLQARIEAPKPFAQYVDELEVLYGGGEPPAQPASDGVVVRWVGDQHNASSLATVNSEVAEPAHRHRGLLGRARRQRRLDRPAARCRARPTSRCATSGRPTSATPASAGWR